jgi:Tfp pilus assembly major pilin PilA
MTRTFEIKPKTLMRAIGWNLVLVFMWAAGDPQSAVLRLIDSIDWLHRNGAVLIGCLVIAGIVTVFTPILIRNIESEMKTAAAARAEARRMEAARMAAEAAAKAEKAAAWAKWRRQHPLATDVRRRPVDVATRSMTSVDTQIAALSPTIDTINVGVFSIRRSFRSALPLIRSLCSKGQVVSNLIHIGELARILGCIWGIIEPGPPGCSANRGGLGRVDTLWTQGIGCLRFGVERGKVGRCKIEASWLLS